MGEVDPEHQRWGVTAGLPSDVPAGTRIALSTPQPPRVLWNDVTMFALALGLLSSEWLLRKRKHLL